MKGFSLVSGPLSPTYQLRTRQLMREMMYETIITHNTNNDKKEIQGRLLTKDITAITPDGDLFQITITSFRGKTPLAKRYFITTLRQFN